MGSQGQRLLVLGSKLLFDEGSPKKSGSSELCNLHVKVHTNGKEEGESWSNIIDIQAGLLSCSNILKTVSNGESKLEFGVCTSFLHVVTGD